MGAKQLVPRVPQPHREKAKSCCPFRSRGPAVGLPGSRRRQPEEGGARKSGRGAPLQPGQAPEGAPEGAPAAPRNALQMREALPAFLEGNAGRAGGGGTAAARCQMCTANSCPRLIRSAPGSGEPRTHRRLRPPGTRRGASRGGPGEGLKHALRSRSGGGAGTSPHPQWSKEERSEPSCGGDEGQKHPASALQPTPPYRGRPEPHQWVGVRGLL